MKRRMTCYMAAWTVLLYGTALGGGLVSEDGWVTSSATSGRMVVDTRAGKGTLTTDHAEGIAYSGLWDGDTDATATVAVDGRTVKTATGEGVYTWTPSAVGTYTLTHRTTKDGVPVGETLTATFTVASRVAPPNAPAVADKVWTFVRSASAAKPSALVSPDGKWRLRAAGPEDGTVYVSYYPPPPPPPRRRRVGGVGVQELRREGRRGSRAARPGAGRGERPRLRRRVPGRVLHGLRGAEARHGAGRPRRGPRGGVPRRAEPRLVRGRRR